MNKIKKMKKEIYKSKNWELEWNAVYRGKKYITGFSLLFKSPNKKKWFGFTDYDIQTKKELRELQGLLGKIFNR